MHRKPFLILAFVLGVGLLLPPPHSAQQPAPPPQQSTPPPPPPDASPAPPAGQNPTVIQSRVNLVDILFTVLNRRNKLVPDLEKADFKIFDDKAPQEIRYFSKQTDLLFFFVCFFVFFFCFFFCFFFVLVVLCFFVFGGLGVC